jgi:sugar/nucleoside kinase (ribokinase family)
MTACWRLLQREVLATLPHRPHVFLDLVDPSGRGESDVAAMLEAVRGFEGPCRTVFGLNLTEAAVITRVLGLPAVADGLDAMAAGAEAIRARLGLSEVVIHNRTGNAVAWQGGRAAAEPGPHCAAPKKSTGAGDRFNAGYCLGLLLGLDGRARLDLGSAMAGFFLRHARSAAAHELVAFLRAWAAGTLPERGE